MTKAISFPVLAFAMLAAASAAEALAIDKDYGTLARGKVADLLVLTRSPLDNIANMRTIEAIYLGGKKFE